METHSPNHTSFIKEYEKALYNVTPATKNFSSLIQHHGANFIRLTRQQMGRQTRNLLSTWLDIDKVNRAWVSMICPVVGQDTAQLYAATSNLVFSFSDVVGDYIVDKKVNEETLQHLIHSEQKFYKQLNNKDLCKSIGAVMVEYIDSLIDLGDIGNENEEFFTKARKTLAIGELLGMEFNKISGLEIRKQPYYNFTENEIRF